MLDLIYLAITIAFFLIALGYIWFCGDLQEGRQKDEH